MARGYVSPWEGAAEGMETGIKLGLDVRRQMIAEERQKKLDRAWEEDRAYTQDERTRKRKHEDEDREWTTAKRELDLVDNELKELGGQFTSLLQQYGGDANIPPDQKATYTARAREAKMRRDQVAERVYGPIKQRYEKHARDMVEGLQSGRTNIGSMSAADTYRGFAGVLKRDPRDLIRDEQGSSVVGRAIKMVQTGLETQDWDQVVAGANIILGPELRVGVGSDGPEEGTTITNKELVSFVPGQRPGTLYPVLEVEVSRPDGAKGYYKAPVTHDRSSNPKSRVKSLDIAQTLDKLGRLTLLEQMANADPAVRSKILQGATEVGPEFSTFLDAAAYVKASPPKTTTKEIPLGGTTLQQTRTESGKLVGERTLQRTVSPDAQERTRARGITAGAAGQGIRHDRVLVPTGEEDENGNPIMEERFVQLPTRAGGPDPKVVDLPDGAKPAPRESQRSRDQEADAAAAKVAGDLGYTKNREGKWVDARGRPAPEVDVQRITQARADALRTSKTAPRKANSGSTEKKPALSQAEVDDLRAKAKKAIADGKDKAAVAKRFNEMTGLNL